MATTYYVATAGGGGSNSNPGTIGSPFLTINYGLSQLAAGSGDILYIRGGTYVENVDGSLIPSGTSYTNAVTVSGYASEIVINKPSSGRSGAQVLQLDNSSKQYIKISNIIFDADYPNIAPTINGTPSIKLGNGGHHIRFTNVELKNCDSSGFLLVAPGDTGTFIELISCRVHNLSLNGSYGPGGNCVYIASSDNLIDGGEFYDNLRGNGIRTWSSDSSAFGNRNTVRNTRIHNCSSGISIADSDNLFYNNLVYNNLCGIQIGRYKYTANNKVYNNTLYGNTLGSSNASGIEFLTPSNVSNTRVVNNIFSSGQSPYINSGTSTFFSNNISDVACTGAATVGDIQFVNASANNFHLLSSSPAIDKGVVIN